MTTNDDPRASTAASQFRQLVETDRQALVSFLRGNPEQNIYLLSRVAVDGVVNEASTAHGRFYGYFGRAGLDGVIFFGHRKGVILAGENVSFIRSAADLALGPESDWIILVGPRGAAEGFLSHYRWRGRPTHLNRVQDYYVVRSRLMSASPEIVRNAELSDLDDVVEMSERMLLEDFRLQPGSLSREGIRESMRHKIQDGRTWVLEEHGQVLFKVDVSAQYAGGAQVEGVFTRPDYRGRGIAARGIAAVAARLLETSDFVSLHVDRHNLAARRAYEKAGFRPHSEFRLILLQVPQE